LRVRGGALLIGAVLLLGACGSDSAEPLAAGEAVYVANCAVCHGPQGTGTSQGPPLVHIYYEPSHHSDEAFERAIREGVVPHHWDFGPMPPVLSLGDEEIAQVTAYVRALQREEGIQ
jgi:mono/diheme cytochrome c family protein